MASVQVERVSMDTSAKPRYITALGVTTFVLMLMFAYMCFFYAPEDLAQGPVQRIF